MDVKALKLRISDKIKEDHIGFPRCVYLADEIIKVLEEAAEKHVYDTRKTWTLRFEEE